jgi:Beta-lactamase enzyme family
VLLAALAGTWLAPGAAGAYSPAGPFVTPAMQAFVHSRGGEITAAVEDINTGRIAVLRPGVAEETASIIKLDILETLLRQDELRGAGLSAADNGLAHGMIENSDNDDATSLWDAAGGPGGVGAYDRSIGMGQTTPNDAWGLTTTTPLDQITLLDQLVVRTGPLDAGAQRYALGLMESVESDQHWGVSGGVPAGVSVALKNGWLPRSGGWQVNSVGRIRGDGRWYLLAVMTRFDPSEGYGIDTIEGISGIVWNYLGEPDLTRLRGGRPFTRRPPR